MAKGNGEDLQDDKILSDVEMVYALAKIKQFKDFTLIFIVFFNTCLTFGQMFIDL